MYFKCDYCGKEGNGMSMVNGLTMCPKPIKHDSFLLSKIDILEDKVIDLQQQLNEMKEVRDEN